MTVRITGFIQLILLAGTIALPATSARADSAASRAAWTLLDQIPADRAAGRPWIRPNQYQALHLDFAGLASVLRNAPLENFAEGARASEFVVEIPMPDGRFERFRVVESPIMEPGLAAKFPEIHTYLGQGIDDPTATVRFDTTPAGFHSQVISSRGAAYIDPYTFGDHAIYTSYWKRDLTNPHQFECLVPEAELAQLAKEYAERISNASDRTSGTQLRTYRLANAATGEYTAFHGGTVALGQAAIVTAINRVTQVYELEVTVRLVLIANNNLVVYTDGATDPYTNSSGSTMLGQNQTNLTNVIGSANYDIGHVFSTGGGGIASLGVVCVSGSKARGVTGLTNPTGDGFYIDFVAHEMGHQFRANHCFNGASTNCGTNRNASTAYEPGSGSTIMSYAGVCDVNDNLQGHSDPYFHSISHEEIMNFVTNLSGATCPVVTNTGNSPPTVNPGTNYTVPSSTPFILTATGSDPNGDTVAYCWEERDLGPAQIAGGAGASDNGSSPLFRSRTGTLDGTRMYPYITNLLLNQYTTKGERLPTTNRTMLFKCTARDNRAGMGGVQGSTQIGITVNNAGGAFSVTQPNTAVTWSGTQTVTWAVAGTNGAPVNCANVKISLSTNSGNSFPTVLLASTPNDGSENVTLPNISANQCKIKVEAVGNIFFDISNINFFITPAAPQPPSNVQATPPAVCAGQPTDLSATVGGTEVVDWFTSSCGGTAVGTGNPLQVFPSGTTTYYARARDTSSGLSSATCTSVSVTLVPAGDANQSGAVDLNDIDPFVDLMLNAPAGMTCSGDMDGDGDVDAGDITLFMLALGV